MIDISRKEVTDRRARAQALVRMSPATLALVRSGELGKGDAVAAARLAGIMAAKKTPELIPLCHPLAISHVGIEVEVEDERVRITADVGAKDRTGVEMEALVAASVAALTIYDMCKALDKAITIEEIALVAKSGGRSGDWNRDG